MSEDPLDEVLSRARLRSPRTPPPADVVPPELAGGGAQAVQVVAAALAGRNYHELVALGIHREYELIADSILSAARARSELGPVDPGLDLVVRTELRLFGVVFNDPRQCDLWNDLVHQVKDLMDTTPYRMLGENGQLEGLSLELVATRLPDSTDRCPECGRRQGHKLDCSRGRAAGRQDEGKCDG